MAISEIAENLKNILDRAEPGKLADYLRSIQFGSLLRGSIVHQLVKRVPVANTGYTFGANMSAVPVDESGAALKVLAAYSRAGTFTGAMTVDADYVTTDVASGHIGVGPNGEINVLTADAITLIDVWYIPLRYKVVEFTGAPATGLLSIPATVAPNGILKLLEAEALAGSVVGKKKIRIPTDGLPATTLAQLKVALDVVQFNNATDAVTSARVKLAIAPSVDLDSMLAALRAF
jgi:hypothetical protein